MKKGLFLLAFLAFTFSVKAEGTGGYTSDITIAEGELLTFESVLASQNTLRNDGWFENCVSGSEIRVYTDYLPNDDSITLNTKVLDVKDANSTPWTYKTVADPETHSSLEWFYLCQQSDTDTVNAGSDEYEKYIQYDTSQDLVTGYEYVSQEELSRVNALQYANTYTANDSAGVQGARARAYNRALINNAVMLPNAGVMLNNLHITITNAQGQTTAQFDTNIVVKLDQILQQVTRIKNDTSTIVSELMFLANAFGFDGSVGSSTSNLAEFLGQWRTADGVWQGEILDSLTNSVDYTDYLKLLVDTSGNPTNTAPFVWMHNTFTKLLGTLGTFGTYRGLLNNSQADFLYGSEYRSAYNRLLRDMVNEYLQNNSSVSALGLLFDFQNLYLNMGSQFQEAIRQTNIVNAVSLGRDWLNLSTNDLASLPYWLNQQDFSSAPPIGVTNWQAQTRWTVLTNQYAQIGLTGSGQQANSTETWNYFKRLEMLLAALVYKPEDEGEKLSNDMNSQSTDAEAKKQDVSNSLDGLLSSFGGQKTLLQGQTSSFLSALGRVNEMFDQTWTPGQWRYWKDGAEDSGSSSGGASGSSVELWIDFSDSNYQFIFDFIRSLCGFVWSFFSLLIIYKFAIFAYKLGMKFARVAYSILRHMFGQ